MTDSNQVHYGKWCCLTKSQNISAAQSESVAHNNIIYPLQLCNISQYPTNFNETWVG